MKRDPESLKLEILKLTQEYAELVHGNFSPESDRIFAHGDTTIPYAGRVFDVEEVSAAVNSALDFWLTLGKEGEAFQKELARYLGVRKSVLTNSGSSANLLAVSALTSPKLPRERRITPGDEVITCAAGFPTTVAPIIQNRAVPVFLDNDPRSGNVAVSSLEEAYVEGKTKAVIFAHALGNPFDLGTVLQFCKARNLWLIEDNCDALGCLYSLPAGHPAMQGRSSERKQLTGSWGDLSTQSFYPPHHITMGEGGAVNIVSQVALQTLVESFRDWGRDCWCESGKDNTCGKRFDWQLGELPKGFDHKYIYSHLGYNLKPLDLQAAIGRVQLTRLPQFVEARNSNWDYLRRNLSDMQEFLDFALPTHATSWTETGFTWDGTGCRTECSWFGFLMLVKPTAPFTHSDLAQHLDSRKIGNRMFFGGNLTRQPAFVDLKRSDPKGFRVVGDLTGADAIMNRALFIGTYPGLTRSMLDYMVDSIRNYIKGF